MASVNTDKHIQNTTQKSLHSGHRERLKKRFLVNNGRDFTDHELLELLLFFVITRVNTNETAHKLINEFGSLGRVFEADPDLLSKVSGVGQTTSLFFALHHTIMNRIQMERFKEERFVADKLSKVGNYLCNYYKGSRVEEFCIMLLDNSYTLIDFSTMSTGSVNSSDVDIRKIAKHALYKDASYVILSHNHPFGSLCESSEDRVITLQTEAALRTIGVSLLEHIIVNDVAYTPTMFSRITSATPSKDASKYRDFYNN